MARGVVGNGFWFLVNGFRVLLSPLSLSLENVEKFVLSSKTLHIFYAQNVHFVILHQKVLIKNI